MHQIFMKMFVYQSYSSCVVSH